MAIETQQRAARIRCYKCGTPEVVGICHHCGRPMCAQHIITPTDGTGAASTEEFLELGLKDTKCGETPIHCEKCDHTILKSSYGILCLGIALALLGFVALVAGSPVWGVIGLLLGGGLTLVGLPAAQRGRSRQYGRPAVPLLPRIGTVQIRETLRGQVRLDEQGRYEVLEPQSEGVLSIVASLGKPERDRLQQYRRRYRLGENEDLTYHMGFAVLQGCLGLRLEGTGLSESAGQAVIPLSAQVSSQPFLSGSAERGAGEVRVTRHYGLDRMAENPALPIRLVPALVQDTAQRALELEMQWDGPPATPLRIDRIESLELKVPVSWGEVEEVTGSATVGQTIEEGPGGIGLHTITWKRLFPPEHERREMRHTFFIRFEKSIDLSSMISGRALVVFDNTISGLTGVDFYFPLGRPRDEEKASIETHVLATFELSLAGLRYQDVRVVPDPKNPDDVDRPVTAAFDGVIPDHATVIALTNALSEDDFYVKRVIENPPRAGERANVFNRYWDIAGRRYMAVYPIDFHLVLTGEEIYGGDVRAEAGSSKVALTVQGAYANPDMKAQIENVWEHLTSLVAGTLQLLPRHNAPSAPALSSPEPLGVSSVPEVTRAERRPSAQEFAPPVAGEIPYDERLHTLQGRMEQVMEALVGAKLLERAYKELHDCLEHELGILQSLQAGR